MCWKSIDWKVKVVVQWYAHKHATVHPLQYAYEMSFHCIAFLYEFSIIIYCCISLVAGFPIWEPPCKQIHETYSGGILAQITPVQSSKKI